MKQFDKKKNRKNSNSKKWDRYQSRDILPMWVADMDFESPACIKSALRKYVDNGIFGYHSEPQVIIPTPIYLNFLKAPKHLGRRIQKIPMVNERGRLVIDFKKLSLIAKKNSWLMFVNPQNPGGTVYSKKELKNLSKIVKEKNITVFSDELHCDLILQNNLAHTPLGSMKTIEKNIVSFYSASKTFNVPGLNCAFAVIPCDKLRKAFKKNAEGITDDANITGLIALSAAFKKGWKWRDDLIRYLNKNLETLLNAIENHKNASPVVPEATYLLWVSLKNPKRKNLQSHFEKYGVGINDGIEFGKKNNIRINFATNHQNIKKASKRIEEALINL